MFGYKGGETKDFVRDEDLTDAELRVAEAVALGLSNKVIASELNLSLRTIEGHISRILDKTSLNNRVELALHIAADRKRSEQFPIASFLIRWVLAGFATWERLRHSELFLILQFQGVRDPSDRPPYLKSAIWALRLRGVSSRVEWPRVGCRDKERHQRPPLR